MPTDNLTQAEAATRAGLLSDVAYDISISLGDATAPTFASTNVITFDMTDPGSTFIDIRAASISEVTVNGSPVTSAEAGFNGYRVMVDGLRVGRNEVRVTALCEYQDGGVGLHRFIDPEDGATYLWTHAEPFDAHRFFPCFDQPDIKARVTTRVSAPVAWQVISNNPVVQGRLDGPGSDGEGSDGEGLTTRQFATTEPIPSYLVHVSAGPYAVFEDRHGEIPLALYSRQSLARYVDAEAIFSITKAGLDWFGGAFGFPYPFAKYDQVFVPQFNMGAMENPGAVTFNETYLPRGAVTDAFRGRRANTILHEMGHVYGFGDLVTMRWWDDLWLNESFATWVATAAVFECTPFTDSWADFANTQKSWAARQDQLPSTHPIACVIPDTHSVRLLFDGISYAKGASVLKQLVAWVGRDRFMAGLRSYFATHRWGNATLSDFLKALETASGRNLTTWSREWLETAGINTLEAEAESASGKVTMLRIRQTAAASHPQLRSHRVAVGFYSLQDGVLERQARAEIDVSGPTTVVAHPDLVGAPTPDLILVNDDDLTYAKLRFDGRSMLTVIDNLSLLADPLARSLCWAATWDMTRDAEMAARDFVELVARHAPAETQVTVLERLLLQGIGAISQFATEGDEHRAALRGRLRAAARGALDKVEAGTGTQLAWMRALIALADTSDELEYLEDLLDGNIKMAGLTIDTELRWQIVGRLASAGRNGTEERIAAELTEDPSDIGSRRAAAALAARPTAAAKAEAWRSVVEDKELPLATLRAILTGYGNPTVGGFSQPDQAALLEPYVAQYFAALPTIWSERDLDEAIDFTEYAFPPYLANDAVIEGASHALEDPRLTRPTDGSGTVLEKGETTSPAQRLLIEARDGAWRVRRARAADRAAAERQPITTP